MTIALNASGGLAEVPLHLCSPSNVRTPVTVHTWVGGEVKIWTPNVGAAVSESTGQLVEKGAGDYADQLTSTQTSVAGAVYLYAASAADDPSSLQPYRGVEFIVDPANPTLVEVPFNILSSSALNGPNSLAGEITGYSFTLGDVQIAFEGGSYANVPVVQLVERMHGLYAVVLTTPQRANVGKVFVKHAIAGAVPFTAEWEMVLGGSAGSTSAPTITVVSPTPGAAPGSAGGFPSDFYSAARTPIVLQVTNVADPVRYTCVVARFLYNGQSTVETVYRRGAFEVPYRTLSYAATITNGLQLTIARDGGWPAGSRTAGDIQFDADAIDNGGTLAP